MSEKISTINCLGIENKVIDLRKIGLDDGDTPVYACLSQDVEAFKNGCPQQGYLFKAFNPESPGFWGNLSCEFDAYDALVLDVQDWLLNN